MGQCLEMQRFVSYIQRHSSQEAGKGRLRPIETQGTGHRVECSTVLMDEAQILLLINEIQRAVTAQSLDIWAQEVRTEAASVSEAFTESAEIRKGTHKNQCLTDGDGRTT